MVSRNYRRQINNSLAKQNATLERSESGLRFSKLSDDVAAGSRAMHIQEERYQTNQQLENVKDLLAEQKSIDSNLSSMHSILQTIQERVLTGMSEDWGDTAREVIAKEIGEKREQLLQFANAQFGGHTLFGGTNNSTPPFTVSDEGKLLFNGIEVEGILEVPAALKEAMDGRNGALFFKFQNPLSEQDMAMADFLAGSLEQVLGGMLEESYYFRAAWYPGEGDSYILGLLMESRSVEEEPEGIDAASPEGRKIIQAIAAAFDIDPAALGVGPDEPLEYFPVGDTAAGGKIITSDGPATQWDAIVP